MKIVRIILFIPTAVLCSWLVYVVWYFVTKWMIGYFITGVTDGDFISDTLKLIANVPAVIVGINAGTNIANFKYSDKILSGIFFLFGAGSILVGYVYSTNTIATIISALVTITVSVAYIFVGEKIRGAFN